MNYKKLQEMQKALDESIIKEKELNLSAEERFELTCHAFLVELSEVANASEHFKFWKSHKGKIDEKRFGKTFVLGEDDKNRWQYTDSANKELVSEKEAQHRTLVEECSDCLHFLLSLANQCGQSLGYDFDFSEFPETTLTQDFFMTDKSANELADSIRYYDLHEIPNNFISDLERDFKVYYTKLGITQEELEQAYYDKNKVNYERLRSDY